MTASPDLLRNLSRKLFIYLSVLLLGSTVIFAQENTYPDDFFAPPLKGRLLLSGTFGELRSNHFHAGIDIKTGGSEGKGVYAIADGYVSRIKVATGGYGKVLYVTHPNGYVSVYGHLQKFNDSLQAYIREIQYNEERFVIEKFPKKGQLKVKKGQLIAYSGNTGGSSAPHLHFEIREASSQHPINPLLFKSINVKDIYRPKIHEMVIYPVNEASSINGKNDTAFFRVGGWGEGHYLTGDPELNLSGPVSFGIRCHDPMNDVSNKNGVYTIELFLDSARVFGLEMDKISFATTRYLNSLIDYGYFKKKKRRVVRTQIDTNNRLSNYREVQDNGILVFNDSAEYKMKFIVKDIYGNTSILPFRITTSGLDSLNALPEVQMEGTWFNFDRVNKFEDKNIKLSFPANTFYQSFRFQFSSSPGDSTLYSPVFHLHNKFTPLQKSCTLSIKPDDYPSEIKEKLYIAVLGDQGGAWYLGSKWTGDWLTATTRSFGDLAVKVDTVPPEIKGLNVYDGKVISGQSTIRVSIKDSETGVKRFRGTLNGDYILFEYEPKKSLLFYQIDERTVKGENNLKVVVSDRLGNETVYEAVLTY